MALDHDHDAYESDFESQFADELELLEELGYEDDDFDKSRPKSQRSLKFASPGHATSARTDSSLCATTSCVEVSEPVKRKASAGESSPDSPLVAGDEVTDLSAKPPEKRVRREYPRHPAPPLSQDSRGHEPTPEPSTLPSSMSILGRGEIRSRIPDGDFMSVTGVNGERVYMSVWDEEIITRQIEQTSHVRRVVNLLSVPYHDLKQCVLQQKDEAVQKEADAVKAMLCSMESEDGVSDAMDTRETSESVCNGNLWVDKYSPLTYTELLSDETVNRSLLQWIKLWDHVVFHRDLPAKPKEPKTKENKKFVKKNEIEVLTELDKHKRPSQKVVLLCGPPGLGKTTLAHIIAQHAGYKVIEMNASDDRSAELFRTTVESSTQMKSVLGADQRPNCLVIDEIDGAPVAAINVLLSLIKYPDGAVKKSKNSQILLRPIICICNDAYVPALRELKKIALVLTFPRTAAPRLATRLYEVVGEEKMKADMNSLLALCEKTDNDIRACLNTLQFLRRQHTAINMRIIQQASVGQKDSHKTLFSVWHDIFTIRKPKRARLGALADPQDREQDLSRWQQANSLAGRFDYILDVMHAAGDYNKVNQGLYENYLEAKSKDPHLTGLVMATDWLCFVDHINQYIARKQDYGPMKYIPYMAVVFHLIYGANAYPKIKYPHTQFEHTKGLTKSAGLIAGLLADMVPAVRKYFDPSAVVMDLLPSLLVVIQPTLRPVNTQLYSSREKADLSHLVHVMIVYNLTYKQEKQIDMQYNYVLEPNMDELVKFAGQKVGSQKPLTYAAKQLIAREVDLEKLRRSEEAYGTTTSDTKVTTTNTRQPKPTASHKPQQINVVEQVKPMRDFFGQIIKKDATKPVKEEKRNILATNVWFHFKAGFSNAVRRNVRVNDFL